MSPCERILDLVSFEHAIEGADHILKVNGELDVYTTPRFTAALKKIANGARIILDLGDCRYLDGSAIAALVQAYKDSAVPIRLVIRDGSMVRRVLEITNVDRLFAIFPTVDAASRCNRSGDVTRLPGFRARFDRASRARR